MSKADLRKQILNLVHNLSDVEKQRQSDNVMRELLSHPKYRFARSLSIYLSTANEIDTKPILRNALEIDGKQCYIPLVRKTTASSTGPRMVMIRLESMAQYEKLPLNKYGIREPESSSCRPEQYVEPCEAHLDLIIVPGVAFASDGRRLGHGRGYYDEFLHYWSKRCHTGFYSIGLAFLEQMVADPCAVEEHDYRLDHVLTSQYKVSR